VIPYQQADHFHKDNGVDGANEGKVNPTFQALGLNALAKVEDETAHAVKGEEVASPNRLLRADVVKLRIAREIEDMKKAERPNITNSGLTKSLSRGPNARRADSSVGNEFKDGGSEEHQVGKAQSKEIVVNFQSVPTEEETDKKLKEKCPGAAFGYIEQGRDEIQATAKVAMGALKKPLERGDMVDESANVDEGIHSSLLMKKGPHLSNRAKSPGSSLALKPPKGHLPPLPPKELRVVSRYGEKIEITVLLDKEFINLDQPKLEDLHPQKKKTKQLFRYCTRQPLERLYKRAVEKFGILSGTVGLRMQSGLILKPQDTVHEFGVTGEKSKSLELILTPHVNERIGEVGYIVPVADPRISPRRNQKGCANRTNDLQGVLASTSDSSAHEAVHQLKTSTHTKRVGVRHQWNGFLFVDKAFGKYVSAHVFRFLFVSCRF